MKAVLDSAGFTRCYAENGELAQNVIKHFRQIVYQHYQVNPRQMPWRDTDDPYCILVSEIMLQQTQVKRVLVKYDEFLNRFPTCADLACATLPEVLSVWNGLGYNRRALALKRCAEQIVEQFCGVVPRTIMNLESLPGIGSYTARAVAAFAFGIATPFIETNIRTVFIHAFFDGREAVADRELMPLVSATLDTEQPREWYYALMDYGVMLKQQVLNPGRRSRHHIRQSSFEGSNRQLRSRILQAVLAYPGVTLAELVQMVCCSAEQVVRNLDVMAREGFLEEHECGFCIRNSTKKG